MRAIAKVFVVGTLGLAVLLSSSTASWALKKQQLPGGECRCVCKVQGEFMSGSVTGLANQFENCGVYNSKTCNVESQDPASGAQLIRSGRTESCCQVLDNGSCVTPTGGQVALTRLQNAVLTTGGTVTQPVTQPASPKVAPNATATTATPTRP